MQPINLQIFVFSENMCIKKINFTYVKLNILKYCKFITRYDEEFKSLLKKTTLKRQFNNEFS